MSHIPASAMHHAKAHEHTAPPEPDAATTAPEPSSAPVPSEIAKVPEVVSARLESLPWAAIAIGAALAAGAAITAALVTRSPAKPNRAPGRKSGVKPRRRKADRED